MKILTDKESVAMKIDGGIQTTDTTGHSAKKSAPDAQLKSIQEQMENVREKMRKLSETKGYDPKDLNRMMRELKMELQSLMSKFNVRQKEIIDEKMEQNKNESTSKSKSKSDEKNVRAQESDLESNPLKAVHILVGSEVTIKEMKTVNAIKKDMNSKTNVIESEIRLNRTYLIPIDKKEEEIYEINKRLEKLNGNGAKKYSDIQKAIEKSQKTIKKTSEELGDEENQKKKKDAVETNGEKPKRNSELNNDMKQTPFEIEV